MTSRTALVAGAIGLISAMPSACSASRWRPLFDGTSLDAWRGYKGAPIPSGWRIVDGTLAKDAPVADIVSKDEFGDFELQGDHTGTIAFRNIRIRELR